MPNDLIPELITEIAKDFTEHLNIPGNSRILFSGKFGKGKTTFLEEYFKEGSPYNKTDTIYNTFYLKPVNYSVATNEDIFKYIKYDIILDFLKKKVTVESYNFSFLDVLPYYVLDKPQNIIKPFVEYIPKVGKLFDEFIKKLEKMYEEIKQKRDKINKSSPSDILINFLEELEGNEYSIYENDVTTKIIEKILSGLKVSEDKKIENVLIIDDLDRIDPEHIFRLLNVFSAHFDNHYTIFGKENKFGFDKVVLVCDIVNIRKIFINKYGLDVDFKGYIDKFYSRDIFFFANYQQIEQVANKIIFEIIVLHKNLHSRFGNIYGRSEFKLLNLINNFLRQDLLTFRCIHTYRNFSVKRDKRNAILEDNVVVDFNKFSFIDEIDFLLKLFGGYSDLFSAIARLEELSTPLQNLQQAFNELVYLFSYRHHKFSNFDDQFFIHVFESSLRVTLKSTSDGLKTITISHSNGNFMPLPKHYYRLLILFIEDIKAQRII